MSRLVTAVACHCGHISSIPLCKRNPVTLQRGHVVNFLSLLEDIVGFLDCVRVHIQSIQVAVMQMAQVHLVVCICSSYELNGQGYLFCLLLIGCYWHSPTMLLRDMLYEGGVRDSNPLHPALQLV